MTKSRRMVVVVMAALLLLLSGSLCALYVRTPAPVATRESGASMQPVRILVAAQHSVFKDRLVDALVDRLGRQPAHVRIIDVTRLSEVDPAEWQVIVLVHTWEFGRAPRNVRGFIGRISDAGKVIDVITSGGGRATLPGVDVISSASVIDELPQTLDRIGAAIDARLAATPHT